MYKIYPSASGFLVEGTVQIEYSSSCMRMLYPGQHVRKDIDQKYKTIGSAHEEWWQNQLQDRLAARELPVKIAVAPGIQYSGRMDFVLKDGGIHETKATSSKTALYKHIRPKQVKLSHLAQLVSYMVTTGKTEGSIIHGFYPEKGPFDAPKEWHQFLVHINEDGAIYVDGVQQPITAQAYVQFFVQQVLTLQNVHNVQNLPPRPNRYPAWKDPCKYCPIKVLCDKADKGNISASDFYTDAISLLGETDGYQLLELQTNDNGSRDSGLDEK